ncbi:MAG: Sua5/YciO/YrdC/YwlC family protein [bacterium]
MCPGRAPLARSVDARRAGLPRAERAGDGGHQHGGRAGLQPPLAQALVERLGEPVVATSANRSGEPAAFTPADCDEAGLDEVDGLVDGGVLPAGASTVVGFVDGELVFFADGDVAEDAVRAAWEPSRLLD